MTQITHMSQLQGRRRGEAALSSRNASGEQARAACRLFAAGVPARHEGRYAAPAGPYPTALSGFRQDESLVFKPRRSEIEQKSALVTGCRQVAEDLRVLGGPGSEAGLEFDDH